MYDIFFIGDKNQEYTRLKGSIPTLKHANDFTEAYKKCFTKFFWIVWNDLIVEKDFTFDYIPDSGSQEYVHVFLNNNHYDGIALIPKNYTPTKKEIDYRFFINKKEVEIVASKPKPFDVFYTDDWHSYEHAVENSTTEMFWLIPDDVAVNNDFDFDFYISHHNSYDRNINHVYKNGDTYDGIILASKKSTISKKEFEYRFLANKKELDIVASTPKPFDKFKINSFQDYEHALANSTTDMFWMIPDDVEVSSDFQFDYYVPKYDTYHRNLPHVFLNGEFRDGVVLLSKNNPVTEKEIKHRFFINKKEVDIVASTPKPFDLFNIDTWEEYEYALENSSTEMFWAGSQNLAYDKSYIDNFYLSHHNTYDRKENHAFIHRVDNKDYYNGMFLYSKNSPLTKKEVEYRFPVNRKEWNAVVSGPTEYEKFYIKDFKDYLRALEKSKTEMFWAIPNNVTVAQNFKFDLYFPFSEKYDREINHVFLNGKYHDGIVLCSKHAPILKREWEYRFINHKKEYNVIASIPKPFDIVFISYNEINADENYSKLLARSPQAKRVHGVKGIHQAHIEAAKLCDTEMFWIVDGDAVVDENFNFDHQVAQWDRDTVHVWQSKNPINDLVYGYGGIKLFPTKLTLEMDVNKPDMSTSISNKFKSMDSISNVTAFDTDAFSTWKSAFRECVKLASKVIMRQDDIETEERLQKWKTVGQDKLFGQYAIKGAIAGEEYGLKNQRDLEALKRINDFEWLKIQFSQQEEI